MFETSIDANRYVEELITREGLDCEYRRVGHFTAAFKPKDYESLEREAEFLEARFSHTTRLVAPGRNVRGAGESTVSWGCGR
jgi:hypothetical protein